MVMPLEPEHKSPASRDVASLHTEPIPYGRDAIQFRADEATALRVQLNGIYFDLPRKDVGPADKWDTIFYLNISPDSNIPDFNPGLYEASVDWYEQQIINHKVEIFVIVPSHKSKAPLKEAVNRANERPEHQEHKTRIIELVGGLHESDVESADASLRKFYVPITTPLGKHIGMRTDDASFLYEQAQPSQARERDFIVWIGEDVISRGGTMKAVDDLIYRASDGLVRTKKLVIAVEAPETTFPPVIDRDVYAAMSIVEIPGGISPNRLVEAS